MITSQKEIDKKYPTDIWINKGDDGLAYASIIQCDQIRTVDKGRITKKIGHLSESMIENVDQALKISLGIT